MSAEEPSPTDEQLNDWLSAYDEALAVGIVPPALDSSDLSPEQQARLRRRLASLHLLHRAMPRGLSGSGGRLSACEPRGQALAGLPWTHLGRFELRGELGRGGFGIVFRAFDPKLGRDVALKVPYPEGVLTPELRERFRREARAASSLDHPDVVPVYEAGEVGPVCFIVSAYCPGITLAQWLRARAEPVPFCDAAGLVATLADAVQHAHSRGVVHRDLKPANVLLSFSREAQPGALGGASRLNESIVKITDFGLVTGSFDHTARAWDVALRRPLAPPVPHQLGVRDVAISPHGELFVTASFDNTARLWDSLTGRAVGPALAIRAWAVSAAFRMDGGAVLVGSGDGTARLRMLLPPVAGDAERVRLWVQTLTGLEQDGDGVVRVLDQEGWRLRRGRLEELDGPAGAAGGPGVPLQ